jgi:hypothetical protein
MRELANDCRWAGLRHDARVKLPGAQLKLITARASHAGGGRAGYGDIWHPVSAATAVDAEADAAAAHDEHCERKHAEGRQRRPDETRIASVHGRRSLKKGTRRQPAQSDRRYV